MLLLLKYDRLLKEKEKKQVIYVVLSWFPFKVQHVIMFFCGETVRFYFFDNIKFCRFNFQYFISSAFPWGYR